MANCIHLFIEFTGRDLFNQVIRDVPCVPRIGERINTVNGEARVLDNLYDYADDVTAVYVAVELI